MTSPGKKSAIPPAFSVEEIEQCIADLKFIQQFQANLKADLGSKQLFHDTILQNGWRTVKNMTGLWEPETKENTYKFISRTCENADKIIRERFSSKESIDHRRAYVVYKNFLEVDKGIQEIIKTYSGYSGIQGKFGAVVETNDIRRKNIYDLYSEIIDREGGPFREDKVDTF